MHLSSRLAFPLKSTVSQSILCFESPPHRLSFFWWFASDFLGENEAIQSEQSDLLTVNSASLLVWLIGYSFLWKWKQCLCFWPKEYLPLGTRFQAVSPSNVCRIKYLFTWHNCDPWFAHILKILLKIEYHENNFNQYIHTHPCKIISKIKEIILVHLSEMEWQFKSASLNCSETVLDVLYFSQCFITVWPITVEEQLFMQLVLNKVFAKHLAKVS